MSITPTLDGTDSIQGSGGGNGCKGEAATKNPDAPAAVPFAWYRILTTGVVLVAGENPPKGEIWCPLYRAPIHSEHPDTERLRYVCNGFDGLGDMDFHERASWFAGGQAEPTDENYLQAYRHVIDNCKRSGK